MNDSNQCVDRGVGDHDCTEHADQGWWAEPIAAGRGKLHRHPDYPDWDVFEQPAGFFIWHGTTFVDSTQTFAAAAVEVSLKAAS